MYSRGIFRFACGDGFVGITFLEHGMPFFAKRIFFNRGRVVFRDVILDGFHIEEFRRYVSYLLSRGDIDLDENGSGIGLARTARAPGGAVDTPEASGRTFGFGATLRFQCRGSPTRG